MMMPKYIWYGTVSHKPIDKAIISRGGNACLNQSKVHLNSCSCVVPSLTGDCMLRSWCLMAASSACKCHDNGCWNWGGEQETDEPMSGSLVDTHNDDDVLYIHLSCQQTVKLSTQIGRQTEAMQGEKEGDTVLPDLYSFFAMDSTS